MELEANRRVKITSRMEGILSAETTPFRSRFSFSLEGDEINALS